MFRAPSNVEILGDQAETSITLYPGPLPQLKPKDTLLITTSDISKVNIVQLTSQSVTFEGINIFLSSLASIRKTLPWRKIAETSLQLNCVSVT
jgi:hypothetical protein